VLFSLLFEKSTNTIIYYVGVMIILSTLFVVVSEIIKKFSSETKQFRNCLLFLGSIIISGVGLISSGLVYLPSFRYQNAINPLLVTADPLTDSVSEHAVTNLHSSFGFLSIFIVFALIGVWFIFSKNSFSLKIDMKVFTLVVAFFGIYLSSAFLRLEVFASIAMFILGGIGLSLFLQEIFKLRNAILKYLSSLIILSLFLVPVVLPEDSNWSKWGNFSPTILSGGGHESRLVSDNWPETMEWIKQNTPENSVIAAWWDYGYWITTLSDRTTIVDNATLDDLQIKKMAYALLADPTDSWKILYSEYDVDVASSFSPEFIDFIHYQPENYGAAVNGMDADYIVIFVTADKIVAPGTELDLYVMTPGGDESKKHWLAKVSNQNMYDFTESDGITPKVKFMESTLGKLIPFDNLAFVDPNTDMTHNNYKPGSVGIFGKNIKYSDPESDPFYLVYASSDFYSDVPGTKIMVFVYKINPNYQS
jgi:dolichyl-diphosphooligosaccharide--protein glycosyltransferase